jgi:HK97 gp10 family phage protein
MRGTISIAELNKLQKKADKFLRTYQAEVHAELEAAATHTRKLAIANLSRNKTNNTGTLRNSIQIFTNPKAYSATVATNTGYGFHVEFGRKPGKMPPIDVIERWVRLKLRVKDNTRVAAFAIARKIAAVGTKPQPFMKPAFEVAQSKFRKRMKALIKSKP